jgi:2-polyprenyl-3-methyl-5-hydroxy-6-metoxy-1,4-benzoquinol methylase
MTDYDTIAQQYHAIGDAVLLREPEWYSLHLRLGDLTGLSVLDLGCGDGMASRRLKQWGAARVVGVDVSAAMIALARQHEQAHPLGIDYRVADVVGLGSLGAFDCVTASYLLHYAQSRAHLCQMVQTVYDNLKPGQRFVASNLNPDRPPQPLLDYARYGHTLRLVDPPLRAWSPIHTTLFLGATTVEFDIYWAPWRTYEAVFRRVGFRTWTREPYIIPPALTHMYGEGFWDAYLAAPSLVHIICQK